MTRNILMVLTVLLLMLPPVNAAFLNISPAVPAEPPDTSWNETYPLLSGARALTGLWNFGGFNASNIGDPVVPLDASNRQWTLSQINSSPVAVAPGDMSPANTSVIAVSDFFDPSTQAVPGFLGAAISSGTVGAVATTARHPGAIYLRDSTTANGGYRFGCAGTQLIGGGETFDVVFQSVGTRITQHNRLGWADSTAGATMAKDGVFFNITNRSGVAGGKLNISGVTAANNARTATASEYPLTASTWYRGTIAVSPTASYVNFTLYNEDGVQLWTDSVLTNIPTGAGRDTSPCIIAAETTTDAAANILIIDYARWAINRSIMR